MGSLRVQAGKPRYGGKELAQSFPVGQWQSQDWNLSFLKFSKCLCNSVSTLF